MLFSKLILLILGFSFLYVGLLGFVVVAYQFHVQLQWCFRIYVEMIGCGESDKMVLWATYSTCSLVRAIYEACFDFVVAGVKMYVIIFVCRFAVDFKS